MGTHVFVHPCIKYTHAWAGEMAQPFEVRLRTTNKRQNAYSRARPATIPRVFRERWGGSWQGKVPISQTTTEALLPMHGAGTKLCPFSLHGRQQEHLERRETQTGVGPQATHVSYP